MLLRGWGRNFGDDGGEDDGGEDDGGEDDGGEDDGGEEDRAGNMFFVEDWLLEIAFENVYAK